MQNISSIKLNVLFLVIISIFCFIIFYPNFKEPLYGETYLAIHYELRNPFSLTQFFSPNWGRMWKPLERLGLYLEYHLFGFNALGYRVINLIFHILISFLVLYFCRLITQSEIISIAVALIFATHFAHWEIAIHTNIIHHFLMVIFYMLTLISFYKFIIKRKNIFYITALLAFIFSILSSQTYVSLVFVMIALEKLINRYKIKDIFSLHVILKYTPFILMTIIHILGSILMNLGVSSPHDPFNQKSLFTFHAPIIKNLIMYLLELFVPIFGSNIPAMLRKVLIIVIVFTMLGLFAKGSRQIRFCVFWLFISQAIFLFWVWPIPMPRYTYLSSIPFSILIGILILEAYRRVMTLQKWKNIYKLTVIFVFSCYVAVSCAQYIISPRIKIFNISGRNSISLLNNFHNLHPIIPDEAVVYFNDLPEDDFFKYGCWTYEDTLEGFLSLFYKDKFTVKFLKKEEMEDVIRNSRIGKKDIFIKFEKNKLYDIKPHK